ncbi:MAG: hypothetical protein GX620_16445 [Chloroflexi bacterium]|nr:hypothetical protein [Chloroflexota bacterium]
MSHGSFATVINCMDGRVQEPVIAWMKQRYGVQYVDSITEPGPILILADNRDLQTIESMRHRTDISVNKHGSHAVAVVSHYDCAGNPVGKDAQMVQLGAAIARVKSWGFGVDVQGLWVDENWQTYPVAFD